MSVTYILDQILTSSATIYKDYTKMYIEIEKLWDFFDETPNIK
jgi:hypothetical protein